MSNLGCTVYMAGVLLCGPGQTVVHTYVAGEQPAHVQTPAEKRVIFTRHFAKLHRNLWKGLTDEGIEAAFADWGPRRHLPIDWSKVKGYQP